MGMHGLLQAGLVLMATALPAAATTCIEEVNRLEAELSVSTELPQAQLRDGRPVVPSTPETRPSETLPPETLPPETLPPETLNDTLSDTLAESGGVIKPPGAPPGSLAERAADDARIRSLLTAARTEAQRGDTGQCMERLREAQTLVGAVGK